VPQCPLQRRLHLHPAELADCEVEVFDSGAAALLIIANVVVALGGAGVIVLLTSN
jgi:hypothetical protein